MSNNKKILSKIKEIITQEGERPKIVTEQISLLLKEIPELEKYINEKDPKLKNDIFYDLGRYINYHKFMKGDIIQRIYEVDKFFYMILTGEIVKIGIKYKRVRTTLKEYILHLTKLQLLEEYYLLNDCIEKNQAIFPFKFEKNMVKIFLKLKGFNFKNELKRIKIEIELSKWRNNPDNIDDFFSLINPSFLKGKESFLSKDMKFPVILPYYIKDEILGANSFIGNLLKIKGIKEFSSYICINKVDILYIDKSTIAPGCKLLNIIDNRLNYSVIDNIIKKNIIFKNSNIDYLINYYSKYFRLIQIKKGQMLICQGRPHEGIYFINKGVFQLKTKKSFYELQELIFSLRDSLDRFTNYISDIKSREEDDLNTGGKNFKNKFYIYKHPLFIIRANEKKDITFSIFHPPQIIGLNELYGSISGIYHFSIYCISDEAEVYFLPNELVNSLLSNDSIYNNIASIIEERAKFLLFSVKKYKNKFEDEFENFISGSKIFSISNFDKVDKKILTLSPISKICQRRNLLINGIQSNEITNNKPSQNNNQIIDEKKFLGNNKDVNKNISHFKSLSIKEKKKIILNLNEQEKNSIILNKINLKNNIISSINNKEKNILSDNNKSLEQYEALNLYSEKNNIRKLNRKIMIKSPSAFNIKKFIFKIVNNNNKIINNNCYNKLNNSSNKNVENKIDKKYNNCNLLPLNQIAMHRDYYQKNNYKDNPNLKSFSNSSIYSEKNFLRQLKSLYFNKNGESYTEKYINQNNKDFIDLKNMVRNHHHIEINRKKINNKMNRQLNLIKSNSCDSFRISKAKQFNKNLLL